MVDFQRCLNRCWCSLCGCSISKGDRYIQINKQARRGTTRTNIDLKCIIKLAEDITKTEYKKIMADCIENGDKK